jgi:hypothetical protein
MARGTVLASLGEVRTLAGFITPTRLIIRHRALVSIIWPQPVLTIRMLKDSIPGVTLDAEIIRNRGMTEIRK